MDTSPEYIKMCDCPEIQEKWEIRDEWRPQDGDYYFLRDNSQAPTERVGIFVAADGLEFLPIKDNYGWLPRQDQIQEMLKWDMIKAMSFFYDFFHDEMIEQEGIGNKPKDNPKFKTLEQLWLAFYMHEKHKKIWNGKEWEKKACLEQK